MAKLTRREILKRAALMAACSGAGNYSWAKKPASLQIGACDWSIGKRADVGAFAVAKSIGLQGVQVSLGTEEDNMRLRDRDRQREYLEASENTGVKITSLAIGELNRVPYKSEARTEEWVWDAVDVARNLNVTAILLAFFDKNDLRGDEKGKSEVIRRLKRVAPKAEKMGITLGIESYLSAEEHRAIMDAVGSESIKVYYDFRNSADAGYDIIREIRWLGKDAICELHMKENGFLLGQGTIDWKRVRNTLVEIGYYGDGWMQIEGARPKEADIVESYKHNHAYLKDIFKI